MPAQRRKFTFRSRNIPCTFPTCTLKFSTVSGLTRHLNAHARLPRTPTVLHTTAAPRHSSLNCPLSPILEADCDILDVPQLPSMPLPPTTPATPPTAQAALQQNILTHPYLDGSLKLLLHLKSVFILPI